MPRFGAAAPAGTLSPTHTPHPAQPTDYRRRSRPVPPMPSVPAMMPPADPVYGVYFSRGPGYFTVCVGLDP